MKITLSKKQWELIGKKNRWAKKAQIEQSQNLWFNVWTAKNKKDNSEVLLGIPKNNPNVATVVAVFNPEKKQWISTREMSKTMDWEQFEKHSPYDADLNDYVLIKDVTSLLNETSKQISNIEKKEGITIFKLIEDWEDQGYGIALISPDDKIVEAYIDPSDYPDMILNKSGNGARVIGGKYKGYLIMFHSGQFEGNEGKDFFEAKSKA